MASVKLKHFARPDMVSDSDWEQGMEVAVKYVEKKINRLNHCGALDESVFGIPAAEHFVFGAFDKLFKGDWEWSPHRAIHTQLVKIALSDISHHLRDWKKKEHVEVVEFDERIADHYGADFKDKRVTREEYDKLINPVLEDPHHYLTYMDEGIIKPVDGLTVQEREKAEKTIEIFNLKHPLLKELRERAIKMVKEYKNQGLTEEDILGALRDYGFMSAVEYALK